MRKMDDVKKPDRFEVVMEQRHSISELTRILRDTETGVQYLFHWSGAAGGLTVLLNPDGKPVT